MKVHIIFSSLFFLVISVVGFSQYVYGDFNPTGGTTYRLAASIGTTDTTIRLSSFKEPVSNIPYTMSYLDTNIMYGTLDPDTTRSEFISFTGITQNSNGTASLTGVVRGLARSPGASDCTTASSTLKQTHAGQSAFIISDSPCFFSQYAVKQNNETITGQWTFDVFPITPSSPAASETTAGIVELATGAELAAGTSAGGTGFRLVPSNTLATSTYNVNTAANVLPVTGSDGTLDEEFIPINTSAGSSTVVTKDASGNWYFARPSLWVPISIYSGSTTVGLATSTLYTYAIPANTLASSTVVRATAEYSYGGSDFCKGDLQLGNGSASTTIAFSRNMTNNSNLFSLTANIYTTAPNTQFSRGFGYNGLTDVASEIFTLQTPNTFVGTADSSYTATGKLYLAFRGSRVTSGTCTLKNVLIEVLTQYSS